MLSKLYLTVIGITLLNLRLELSVIDIHSEGPTLNEEKIFYKKFEMYSPYRHCLFFLLKWSKIRNRELKVFSQRESLAYK